MIPHAIMFHHFHDDEIFIKSQGSLTDKELDALLQYYKDSEKYSLITAKEWYRKATNGKLNYNDVCLSFDDGLKCQQKIAYPILKKHNLTAFFFIPTFRYTGGTEKIELYRHFRFSQYQDVDEYYEDFFTNLRNTDFYIDNNIQSKIDNFDYADYLSAFPFYTKNDKLYRYIRDKCLTTNQYDKILFSMMESKNYNIKESEQNLYLSVEDIRCLHDEGNIIGLHSHTHPTVMSKYDYFKQESEFTTNKEILSKIVCANISSCSYPCNSYDDDTLKIMKALDIKLGFRANMEKGNVSILEMAREDHANILRRMKNENYGIY